MWRASIGLRDLLAEGEVGSACTRFVDVDAAERACINGFCDSRHLTLSTQYFSMRAESSPL